jgi:hypothetical protein
MEMNRVDMEPWPTKKEGENNMKISSDPATALKEIETYMKNPDLTEEEIDNLLYAAKEVQRRIDALKG